MELLIKLMTFHYAVGAILFAVFVTGLLISVIWQVVLWLKDKSKSKKK